MTADKSSLDNLREGIWSGSADIKHGKRFLSNFSSRESSCPVADLAFATWGIKDIFKGKPCHKIY